jgi:hypothetical protein
MSHEEFTRLLRPYWAKDELFDGKYYPEQTKGLWPARKRVIKRLSLP